MCKINEQKECKACKVVFMICLIVSIVLIVAGFCVRPTGIIDGSVLTAIGELIAFPAIGFGFRAVELGYDMKINHGNTTIEIDNDD